MMASDPNEQKGMQLVAEAEKKLKGSSGFLQSLFGRGTQKLEDACDLYARAANSFKMAKNWAAAGNAFCQCSDLQLKMESRHDAATSYVDAANCYRKTDPREAVACLVKAIEIYTDMGRFTIAAKHHMTIAEIYESDVVDIEQAIRNYERSADYYRGEESNSLANKCLLRVAQLVVQVDPPQYHKAVDIFEQLATSAMDNSLLKYSAKEYFFKAALCRMCTDHLDGQKALTKYEEMYPAFADSREYKLLKKLCQALEEGDVDAYTEAVADYDSISRLDPWLTSVMLKIKKTIMKDEGEEGGIV